MAKIRLLLFGHQLQYSKIQFTFIRSNYRLLLEELIVLPKLRV